MLMCVIQNGGVRNNESAAHMRTAARGLLEIITTESM